MRADRRDRLLPSESEESLNERGKLVQHGLLLGCVRAVRSEARDGRKDSSDRGSGPLDCAVSECDLDESTSLVGIEVLVFDDLVEFRPAARLDECSPFLTEVARWRDGVDERLDEILLAAQGRARIHDTVDRGEDLLVVSISARFACLLDEEQDVVAVDFDLLDELYQQLQCLCSQFLQQSVSSLVSKLSLSSPSYPAVVKLWN